MFVGTCASSAARGETSRLPLVAVCKTQRPGRQGLVFRPQWRIATGCLYRRRDNGEGISPLSRGGVQTDTLLFVVFLGELDVPKVEYMQPFGL